MRMALWIASPPTCSVRTPRDSLTAMEDFGFANEQRHAARGKEGECRAGEDRHVVAAEPVEGDAGEPGADQRADPGAGIGETDDSGHRPRSVEIHRDRRGQRHEAAVE